MTNKEISFIIYKEIGFYKPIVNWAMNHNNMILKMGLNPYDAPTWQSTQRKINGFVRIEKQNTNVFRKLMLVYKQWKNNEMINKMKNDFN